MGAPIPIVTFVIALALTLCPALTFPLTPSVTRISMSSKQDHEHFQHPEYELLAEI